MQSLDSQLFIGVESQQGSGMYLQLILFAYLQTDFFFLKSSAAAPKSKGRAQHHLSRRARGFAQSSLQAMRAGAFLGE
jgi:hypothetical protein